MEEKKMILLYDYITNYISNENINKFITMLGSYYYDGSFEDCIEYDEYLEDLDEFLCKELGGVE